MVDFATCFELAALARDGGVIDLSRLGDGAIGQIGPGFQQLLRNLAALRGAQVVPALIDADDVVVGSAFLLAITELEPVGG